MKPGIYKDLPNNDYHAAPGVSKSGLDLVAKCPAMYKRRYIDGIASDPTPAMILGSAVHTATLEPDKFDAEYACAPEINRRTKAGKAEWEQFQADNEGKTVLSATDHATAMAMAEAVKKHPVAGNILANGEAEASIFHRDERTAELVKVRPDWMIEDCLVDLKTTQDGSKDAFARACANFRYHVQAAMYNDVVTAQTGRIINNFIFIVVERNEPYNVSVYVADNDMISLGRELYRSDLATYAECKHSGNWPGYNHNKIETITLPGWAYKL